MKTDMKIEDKGVWIPLMDGEERLVPWKVYNKVIATIQEARTKLSDIPRGLRWMVKKAMKDMEDNEYAHNSLAQMILTVEGVGGSINWGE